MTAPSLPASTTLVFGPQVVSAIQAAATLSSPSPSGIIVQGWTSEPSTRGTWSLLYSCVFTIGLCIWTALHLNVPSANEGQWILFFRKVGWMGYAFVAPEFVFGIASHQLYNAWQLRRALRKIARQGVAEGAALRTLSKAAQIKKGQNERGQAGLAGSNEHRGPPAAVVKKTSPVLSEQYTMTYCFYANMGGFTVDLSETHQEMGTVTLTGVGVKELAERGHHLKLSHETISDKSKADLLAKGLVVCQITWLVLQSAARKVAGLPLTLLELHAMSHVGAAVALYMCWWFKPKDIADAISIDTIASDRPGVRRDIQDMASLTSREDFPKAKNPWLRTRIKNNHMAEVSEEEATLSVSEMVTPLIGSLVVSAGFAGLHMSAHWAATEVYFPTSTESLLWTIACYYILGISAFGLMVAPLTFLFHGSNGARINEALGIQSRRYKFLWGVPICVLCIIIVFPLSASRLYLIVESFMSLRQLPLEVYVVPDWSSMLPHL